MKANEIREYLAQRYQDKKFKGFQQIFFLLNNYLEEGVILDFAENLQGTFYRVGYLDDNLNIVHRTINEKYVFSTYDHAYYYLSNSGTHDETVRQILKHHQKAYFIIKDSIGMEIDEYLIHVFFNGPVTPTPAVIKRDLSLVNKWASKVLAMRNAQSRYFKERNYADLTQSKALEKEVDDQMDTAIKSLSSISSIIL